MPRIDSHKPGTFCWIELATTDQESAKAFYSNLFGWASNDLPMGPGETYTMFNLDGQTVGAAFRITSHMPGLPPNWTLYIAVANADDTAKKAAQLGAKLLKEPFDVFDAGRMAVIEDPTGAAFCIWQAGTTKGIDISGEEGALCWADLSTPDPDKAQSFYKALFDWRIAPGEHDPSGYLHIQNGDAFIGGIQTVEQRNPHAPPHWLIYLQSSDCDGDAAKAEAHGGHVHMPPVSIPNTGRFAVLSDPQGAVFALYEPLDAA